MTTTNNGLLLIDKAQGLTSHDVVSRVRRILGEKRVGHAGTLDPMATGLLILGVGASTRLLRFAQAETKHYTGTVKFGIATDSLDADGVVIATKEVPALTPALLLSAADGFIGEQDQVPPMVSALKINGKRLHELAREGIEVERQARRIVISNFTLTPTATNDEWDFSVTCSVGTYVRVLLSDLAQALGTLGHLTALRREASGDHVVTDALTIENLESLVKEGKSVLRPPSDFVHALTQVVVSDEVVHKMRMGQRFILEDVAPQPEVAVLDQTGKLVGIIRPRGEGWQPELVMPAVG